MRLAAVIFCVFSFIFLLLQSGCEPSQVDTGPTSKTINGSGELSIYLRYTAAKVYILPLTDAISIDDDKGQLKVYVSLVDSFGSQIKTPVVFRFEIYDYVQRSSEPKGKRVAIWPDINLTEPAENNKYWRDFLRAYEFKFPFKPESEKSYIIQANCICPNGKRLSAEFILKHTK